MSGQTEAVEETETENEAIEDQKAQPSVARSTALMSIATLGSRATGLVRTWAMAFALGNTMITSAYQVANNMPNVIYELVAGGLLAAALIPVYLSQKEKLGTAGGNKFASVMLNLVIIVLGLGSVAALVFAPQVIATQTFTVDSTAAVTEQAVRFFRIFAFQIVFYGIGGVVTGILNANRIYFLPSLAPALNNIVVIASFFAFIPLSTSNMDLALNVLAIGTTLGVAVQFVIQIPALFKSGFRYSFSLGFNDPDMRAALVDAFKIAAPTFIYVLGMMVAFSARNAFSLAGSEEGPSTLLYAWTWYQLPYGVVGVSLSRALFTEMSEAFAKNDMDSMRGYIESGISSTLLLIIPMAGLMAILATPIMMLFQAGAFDGDAVNTVACVLAFWVVSLPCYSAVMYLYNVFACIRKFFTFAIINCAMVIVQVGLYAVLCQPNLLGVFGVPVADFVYYTICCIICSLVLKRLIGSFGGRIILSKAIRVVVATLMGMLSSGIIYAGMTRIPGLTGIIGGLVILCVSGLIGLVICFAGCALQKVPEMSVVTNILKRFKRA